MKKTKEHTHTPYVERVFELTNYTFVIAIIKCSDENCDWRTWDYGDSASQE